MRRVILSNRPGCTPHRLCPLLHKEIPQCPIIFHAGEYEVVINVLNILIIPCRVDLHKERKDTSSVTKTAIQTPLLF